jgi:signal transduction histidine kinase
MAIQKQTQAALDQYGRTLEPDEQDTFAALRAEVDAWWQVLQTAFQWTPAERSRLRYTFFYEQLVPRRTTMLQIADRIAEINERGLNRAEGRLSASAENLRSSLLVTFGIALLGGIVLAAATIALTRRLEREVERRLKENSEARADLQALSARLVRAQEDERRTLARELHDEVGQSLSAIMMEAGNAEAAVNGSDLRRRVSSIGSIAENALNVVRDLALLLRPSMLDDFGLVPALNWHAREMTKRTGLNVRVTADPASGDLPDEHKTCIYRLVQEALNNAARHASARNLQVAVKNQSDRVIFSVQDDGSGFDKASVRGLGLLGMEERVRRLGGTFRIDSQLGRGTTISAELPLPEMAETEHHAANSHTAG